MCGENESRSRASAHSRGSSPRVRGKHLGAGFERHVDGLIPACAGKTRAPGGCGCARRAHPRVCGENQLTAWQAKLAYGSSPRVRGKRGDAGQSNDVVGLIPACAGKTLSTQLTRSRRWAHPRVCGENAERSGVLTLRSVRSWKTLSFPSSLKITHCRAFVQLSLSRIRL